jgi:hypothetical protein
MDQIYEKRYTALFPVHCFAKHKHYNQTMILTQCCEHFDHDSRTKINRFLPNYDGTVIGTFECTLYEGKM